MHHWKDCLGTILEPKAVSNTSRLRVMVIFKWTTIWDIHMIFLRLGFRGILPESQLFEAVARAVAAKILHGLCVLHYSHPRYKVLRVLQVFSINPMNPQMIQVCISCAMFLLFHLMIHHWGIIVLNPKPSMLHVKLWVDTVSKR